MATHLTKRYIATLKAPKKGYRIWYDDEVKGFGIRITANGAMTFVLNYYAKVKDEATGEIRSKERRVRIARCDETSPEAARRDASEMKRYVRDGLDPVAVVEPDPEPEPPTPDPGPTMKELADDYIEDHAVPRKKPSSVKQDRRMIKSHVIPVLGKMRVSDVSRRDVEKLHNSLKGTPYEANRVKSLLSKMFNLAIGWEMREKNPCKGIEKFEEPKHEFWLNVEEFGRLERALNEYEVQEAADAIRLLALTGAREGEALNATWDQFDLAPERETWTKPSHATKEKKTETVPLNERALALLRRMAKSKTSIYLFPRTKKRSDEADKPRTTVRDCWEMSCRKAGLCKVSFVLGKRGEMLKRWKPTIRINDLRHSFASHLVSSGASLNQVGELMGHTQPNTTKRYAHCFDVAQRAVTNRFTAFGGNVVEMRPPKKTPKKKLA